MEDHLETLERNQKNVSYYAAGVAAWYASKFELDKHLLNLSAGAIGLLVTLLTTIGVSSKYTGVMYGAALVCFLICIASVLCIFRRNPKYIEKVIVENADENDPLLSFLDKLSVAAFSLGALFMVFVGLFSTFDVTGNEDLSMSGDKETMVSTCEDYQKKSLNGVSALRPSDSSNSQVSSSSAASSSSDKPSSEKK